MFADGSYGVEQDGSTLFTSDGSSNVSFTGGNTVEWVVEGPGLADSGQNFTQISDFGTVQFFNLRAGLPSWSLTPDEKPADHLQQPGRRGARAARRGRLLGVVYRLTHAGRSW